MDRNKLKQEEEDRWASIVIDAFSRYDYIYPMKNKNSKDVLKAKNIQNNWGGQKNIAMKSKKIFRLIRDSTKKKQQGPMPILLRD